LHLGTATADEERWREAGEPARSPQTPRKPEIRRDPSSFDVRNCCALGVTFDAGALLTALKGRMFAVERITTYDIDCASWVLTIEER
jgi:hypothetical protein